MIKKPVKLCEVCITNPVSRTRRGIFNLTCSSCDEDIGQCCLCYGKIGISFSYTTCFGLRICRKCSREQTYVSETYVFERLPKSTAELKNEKMYKKFLRGKAYPEVKVWHKAMDGAETTNPIRDAKFFVRAFAVDLEE